MKSNDLELIIRICKMYYEEEFKQEEIANDLNISRAKVSRSITKAKELGYIRTVVLDPFSIIKEKELKLAEDLGLKDVKIAILEEGEVLKSVIGAKTAEYVMSILKDGDIIGVSWGVTMKNMIDSMISREIKDLTVVQLKGSIPNGKGEEISYFVAEKLGEKFDAKVRYLHAPVMVSSKLLKEQLLNEPSIKSVVDLGKKANIAVFTIGYPSKKSTISNCGYITGEELEDIRAKGAVGEICSRFFNVDGTIYDKNLNDRNTSIELEDLREKEFSIGISGGDNCIPAIIGAINGGYINCLVVDEYTADKLLMYNDSIKK